MNTFYTIVHQISAFFTVQPVYKFHNNFFVFCVRIDSPHIVVVIGITIIYSLTFVICKEHNRLQFCIRICLAQSLVQSIQEYRVIIVEKIFSCSQSRFPVIRRDHQILNKLSPTFPAGLCAERSLLFYVQTNFPDDPIETLAIASDPSPRECYPCGQCRQVMVDVERRQGRPMRIVMSGGGTASAVDTAEKLLPFTFKL